MTICATRTLSLPGKKSIYSYSHVDRFFWIWPGYWTTLQSSLGSFCSWSGPCQVLSLFCTSVTETSLISPFDHRLIWWSSGWELLELLSPLRLSFSNLPALLLWKTRKFHLFSFLPAEHWVDISRRSSLLPLSVRTERGSVGESCNAATTSDLKGWKQWRLISLLFLLYANFMLVLPWAQAAAKGNSREPHTIKPCPIPGDDTYNRGYHHQGLEIDPDRRMEIESTQFVGSYLRTHSERAGSRSFRRVAREPWDSGKMCFPNLLIHTDWLWN